MITTSATSQNWKQKPVEKASNTWKWIQDPNFSSIPTWFYLCQFLWVCFKLVSSTHQQMGTQVEQLWISIWDLWEQQWEQMWLQISNIIATLDTSRGAIKFRNLLGCYRELQKLLIKSHGKKYFKILEILLQVDNLFHVICIISFTFFWILILL
jgi:hypothetical protein